MRKNKRLLIITGIVLLLAVTIYLIYYFIFNPYRDFADTLVETPALDTVLTAEEAREDLDYVMRCLRRYHPAYADDAAEWIENVEQQYENELSVIQGNMTILDEWKMISRLMSATHTTHCGVYLNADTRYIQSFEELNNHELVSVNGVPYDELFEDYLMYAFYERGCEGYIKATFANNLIAEAYLQMLGIDTENGVDFTFLIEEKEQTFHYEFVEIDQIKQTDEADSNQPKVFYEIDDDNKIGVLTLKYCNNDDYYINLLSQFFNEISEKRIESIIVDLRGNPGGSSNVANSFIEHLAIDSYQMFGEREVRFGPLMWRTQEKPKKVEQKENAYAGELYVLTSSLTCSAAVDFSAAIQDNKLGIIIGEIPGNTPTCYTNMKGVYQTANSGLRFYIPGTISHRADITKDSEPLYPDYEINSFSAMDTAYNLILGERQ